MIKFISNLVICGWLYTLSTFFPIKFYFLCNDGLILEMRYQHVIQRHANGNIERKGDAKCHWNI